MVVRQRQRRLTASEKVAVAQQYRAGAEMRELAVTFKVHRASISRCLRELGIPLRRQGLRAEDVPEAAKLYEAGWSLAQLGEKYGCAHTTIRLRLMESLPGDP
jgi:lambda repressor-like predicted transcriptional regulator